MKDHVEIGHLTKYDASRVNRDQVMELGILFKINTSLISRKRPQKPYKLLKFLISFLTAVQSCHAPTI